jgi:hypothetical protein
MTEKKRKSKAGAPRTEVFAMRFDPKLKYLAEIAARRQRRSLANFVEWAIDKAIGEVPIREDGPAIADLAMKLWALDEPTRLINLATNYQELLTYDEQLIWRVICEHSVWNKVTNRHNRFKENEIDTVLVRNCWQEIKAYALGTGTQEALNAAILEHDSIPF